MDRAQVDGVVRRVHVLWNQPPKDLDEIGAAWWRFLHDLESEAVHQAVDDLMVDEPRFMPKVGEIRRRVLAPQVGVPAPIVAWAQFQARLRGAATGSMVEVHELVLETMRRLHGGEGMHTNGDREVFMDLYRSVVAEVESERYRVQR